MQMELQVEEQQTKYGIEEFPFQEETYRIIGKCMEVHKYFGGKGFSEVVYKDALEHEFKIASIFYEREKKYEISYKGIILPHYYFADFVVFGNVMLEVKSQREIIDEHHQQTLNYLAVSKLKIGLIVNFGEESLKFKRLILSGKQSAKT